ncbi:MAG: type II toxin-antitoxin system RelE/ParE family toxin [Phascolarctobacterium sp.]|nr:type II toxin-antitoxin system RelE/ParE family toxin [Phascolarctobacterium sp.]
MKDVCTNYSCAVKKYGEHIAYKIHQRIDSIRAFDRVEELIAHKIGRCHALQNDRKGQYAMDLEHPYRLIFSKNGNEIQIVNILEIVDYH